MVEIYRRGDSIPWKKGAEKTMKSREDYPYIYFFTEPNVVFVYKIVGEEYVTVSDLSEQGDWETYELSPSDEFGILIMKQI